MKTPLKARREAHLSLSSGVDFRTGKNSSPRVRARARAKREEENVHSWQHCRYLRPGAHDRQIVDQECQEGAPLRTPRCKLCRTGNGKNVHNLCAESLSDRPARGLYLALSDRCVFLMRESRGVCAQRHNAHHTLAHLRRLGGPHPGIFSSLSPELRHCASLSRRTRGADQCLMWEDGGIPRVVHWEHGREAGIYTLGTPPAIPRWVPFPHTQVGTLPHTQVGTPPTIPQVGTPPTIPRRAYTPLFSHTQVGIYTTVLPYPGGICASFSLIRVVYAPHSPSSGWCIPGHSPIPGWYMCTLPYYTGGICAPYRTTRVVYTRLPTYGWCIPASLPTGVILGYMPPYHVPQEGYLVYASLCLSPSPVSLLG